MSGKLLFKVCPICRNDYQYEDEDEVWCPHCGATEIAPGNTANPLRKVRKMTIKEAKEILKPLGLWLRIKDGEYRVAFPRDEASAYYTNDLDDAVNTGCLMAKTRR